MKFLWSLIPAGLRTRLQTKLGQRFRRFLLVAVAAVFTSQVTLLMLLHSGALTPGEAGTVAAMAGAAVSYVLSRWAWERKGRPDLLRETVPFWAVSVAAWLVLGLATHYAEKSADAMGLAQGSLSLAAWISGCYFFANCLTFLGRFAFFHWVLFTERAPALAAAGDESTGA